MKLNEINIKPWEVGIFTDRVRSNDGRIASYQLRISSPLSVCMHIVSALEATDPIDAYGICRILMNYKLADDPAKFELQIYSGYYGEETGDVTLRESKQAVEAEQKISEFLALPIADKIPYLLKLEYGFLIPSVKAKEWRIETVDFKDIKIGNEEHFQRVDRHVVSLYADYADIGLPVCLCVKEGKFYRLIDGYHRLVAVTDQGNDRFKIIVGV